MVRALFRLVLLLSLTLLSCKEEIVISGPDALTDPRFAPRVIASKPPMNTPGPYAFWDATNDYRIYLRFNKLMDPASVMRGLRLVSTTRPVGLSPYWFEYADLTAEFTIRAVDSGSYRLSTPRLGEVLTLSAAAPLVDVNGNIMPAGLIGVFRPEPHFRVREVYPPEGATRGSIYADITITFNSNVDSSIQRYIHTVPPATEPWSIPSYDSTSVFLRGIALPLAASYSVAVDAGVHDKKGNVMPAPFSATFRSPSFNPMFAFSPYEVTDVPLYRSFELRFSLPIDTASVSGAFHILPDVESALRLGTWADELEINAVRDYVPRTRYAVTIDTSLRSQNGFRLERPVSFWFTTDAFSVSSTSPRSGTTGASVSRDLEIYCTGRLDSATVRNAFRISPPVEGMLFPVSGSPWFTFYLADTLRSHTTYTVTIDSSLRSREGARLEAPHSFTFTTGGP